MAAQKLPITAARATETVGISGSGSREIRCGRSFPRRPERRMKSQTRRFDVL